MTGLWVDIAFIVFAVAAAWFGWRVFRTDSMVRATFALLASFLNVGAIMVLLLAEFLGVALFFMMGAEMVVMAIFMVAFMMNPAGLNPMMMIHQPRVAVVAGVVAAAGLIAVALTADLQTVPLVDLDGTIRRLGLELMGGSMLLMQTVGVTLLATMVGATVLSAGHGRFGESRQGSRPPALDPDDPQPGEVGGGDVPATGGHGGMGHDMGGMDHSGHDMGGDKGHEGMS